MMSVSIFSAYASFTANRRRRLAISVERQLHRPLQRRGQIRLCRHSIHRVLLLQLYPCGPTRHQRLQEGVSWIPRGTMRQQGRRPVHVYQDERQALWYPRRLYLYRSRDQRPCCYVTSSVFPSTNG
jgi:hypothetical protein